MQMLAARMSGGFVFMLVMKFGGTSVGSAQRMEQVVELTSDSKRIKKAPIVVLSAMSGVTNGLIDGGTLALKRNLPQALSKVDWIRAKHSEAIRQLFKDKAKITELEAELDKQLEELRVLYKGVAYLGELSRRSIDAISGMGELLSTRIVAALAESRGIKAVWVDARRFLFTDDTFGKATPLWEQTRKLANQIVKPQLDNGVTVFTQGFIGSTVDGVSTTLGRGGSDYSASIIGAALDAEEIQIWTDVDGMMSADPRVVPEARLLGEVSFQEASELAYFGAKVLHPLTIKPAVEKKIPVRILNTFNPDNGGTLIKETADSGDDTIRAVAAKKNITAIFLSSPRMLMTHGFLAQVFAVFERHRVPIDLISTSEVSVALTIDNKEGFQDLMAELQQFGEVQTMDDVAIVSVVGRQFRVQSGIAGRVFKALSDINIMVISGGASEINLNFVVASSDADKAVKQLHAEFFPSLVTSR
jgi:aspartate kinase